jgi:hypothetical protein
VNVTVLPTPTGLGFTVGFEPGQLLKPAHEKVIPFVFGPILLTKASLAPERLACNGATAGMLGSVATGKFPDAVSPAT